VVFRASCATQSGRTSPTISSAWADRRVNLTFEEYESDFQVGSFSRWDIGQLGGSAFTSWDNVKQHISNFPNHRVLRGTLVEAPGVSAGVTYYDDITMGDWTLWDASDTIGN
jgi:hypothetical protein